MTRDELIRAVVTEIDRQSPNLISASMSIIDLVLEEAAKVAEGRYPAVSAYDERSPLYGSDLDPDRSDLGRGQASGRSNAASAIRALKGNRHE